MLTAGAHVPVIPLFEVVGSVGAAAFWQASGIVVNVGVTLALTVMVSVVVVAH